MSGGLDYDHELNNGWSKFQNLILQEMKRLADGLENQDEKLTAAILDAAVSRTQFDALKTSFEQDKQDAKELHEDHEQRLRTLESGSNQFTGIRKYKEWAIPLAVMIIINLVTWWLFISSSHPSPHLPGSG